jgi:hypothetical protein
MGTLTRAAAESKLVARAGPWMALVGMSVAATGSNPDLDDTLTDAFLELGLVPLSIVAVASSDLGTIPDGRVREYLLRAELRLLRAVRDRWTLPSQQVGQQSRLDWRDILQAISKAIDDLEARIEREFGLLPAGAALSTVTETAPSPDEVPEGWPAWLRADGGFR